MATFREVPYSQFNFLVSWDGLDGEVQAGFQEVSGLGGEITVAEYRRGNSQENTPIKVNTLTKIPDVTLKRGVIGDNDLYDWFARVSGGELDHKEVKIDLLAEDRSGPVVSWKLRGARPMKYTAPTLNAKGNEVAIEELVLAAESIVQT